MKKCYYLCAYGHVIRYSQKCYSAHEAAQYCYGVTDRVTCLNLGTRSPRYVTHAQKVKWQEELEKLHKERTGNTRDDA